ncbi:hypothetical protein U9M48_035503 [Paspalum notatum var. saurae]|uniref:Uncharacterized protein n=1 Tax=Paspalum notatum var. saurae TaxID=547442 RepID=A0AAQ3UCR5_PASNO
MGGEVAQPSGRVEMGGAARRAETADPALGRTRCRHRTSSLVVGGWPEPAWWSLSGRIRPAGRLQARRRTERGEEAGPAGEAGKLVAADLGGGVKTDEGGWRVRRRLPSADPGGVVKRTGGGRCE